MERLGKLTKIIRQKLTLLKKYHQNVKILSINTIMLLEVSIGKGGITVWKR